MELMSLGLPLQGPGWTECACVGVCGRGWGHLHGAPPDGLESGGTCMFLDPCSFSGALSTAWSRPPTNKCWSRGIFTAALHTAIILDFPCDDNHSWSNGCLLDLSYAWEETKKQVQVHGQLPTPCDITKRDSTY